MPAIAPPTPDPPTLRAKPSWHNRAGRVDRSTCLELRASELWPHAKLPPHRSKRGLEAVGHVDVSPRFLRQLHDSRLPQALVGDLRTDKSNAMRVPPRLDLQRAPATACLVASREKFRPAHANTLILNPNKGATRTKKLGLLGGPAVPGGAFGPWTQTIRVERHRIHDLLAKHYLICPCCRRRYQKLFMILCTEQEMTDAETAEGWINVLDARKQAARVPLSPDLIAHRAALIARYGLLFRDRRLQCKKCLGIRYGEVRKSRRPRLSDVAYARAAEREQRAIRREVKRQAEFDAFTNELHSMLAPQQEAHDRLALAAMHFKHEKRIRETGQRRKRREAAKRQA